jgi:hypothetical protein
MGNITYMNILEKEKCKFYLIGSIIVLYDILHVPRICINLILVSILDKNDIR